MASKGSQGSAPSERIGLIIEVAPANSAAVRHSGGRSSGGNVGSYEKKWQVSDYDKQNASYTRETATEKATAGKFHWKNGTSGNRSEYKQTVTTRIGNKNGYTEVYNERRYRNVTYDNYGDKSVVNYGGGAYGRSSRAYGGRGSGAYGGHSGSYVGGGGGYGGSGGAYSDSDSDSDSDY